METHPATGMPEGPLVHELAQQEALAASVDAETLRLIEQRRRATLFRRRGWVLRRLLMTADVIALALAFAIAEISTHGAIRGAVATWTELALFVATLPAWVVIARAYRLYGHDQRRTDHSTPDELADVANMITFCTWIFFAFTWLTGIAHPPVTKLLIFWVLAIGLLPLLRAGARVVARTNDAYLQNTVIVGAGEVGQTIAEKLLRHPEYGLNLVGFVDSQPKEQRPTLSHLTILGPPERLGAIVRTFDVERVIVAFSHDAHERVLELIRSLDDPWLQVDIVPRYFDLIGDVISLHRIEGIPLVGLPPRALPLSSRLLKRGMDVVVSGLLLVLLAVPFAVIGIAIKLDSRGPVFFRQRRVGGGGRDFLILKFRTMVRNADVQKDQFAHLNKHANGDARMFKIRNDPRVTRIGRVLRRASLDELPQLWNVLRGQMSLVGPRPLIPSEDVFVEDWGRKRLHLRPGMTGLWQVLGSSDIPFEEMVRLDYLYVTSWSLWHDLRLLGRTLPAMVRPGKSAC